MENWLKKSTNKDDEYLFYQNESFITFGYGKRDCVGKQLAMKELRILFGYLLLNYKLSLKDPNQEIMDSGGNGLGVNRLTPPIPVVIQKI